MARESQPVKRAADVKKEIAGVRRKYKVSVNQHTKLLPAEVPYIEDTVVVLKVAGYTRTQMAKIIGISKGQVREILEKPEVSERIVVLRKKLPNAAVELIQNFMIEAVVTIADIMRTERDSKIRMDAARELLDRGGAPKTTKAERHNLNEEKTTFADDGIVDKLRRASPEVQEQAATMIEGLEKLLSEHANAGDPEDE